jgi:hypothetical protein
MSEYGYLPEAPTQSYGDNKGIFSPTDIYNLDLENKFTTVGSLELIQTQTVSSATCTFSNLKQSLYNVHFFTFNDIHFGSQTELGYRLSNDGGSTFETGYSFCNQRGIADGSFADRYSTSQDSARLCGDIDEDAHSLANGVMYLYNAGNSSVYTYATSHMSFVDFQDYPAMEFGSQQYNHAEEISAIKFGAGTAIGAMTSATISLYGLRN